MYIYKHFVEKNGVQIFWTFTVFFMRQKLHEFEQNLIDIHSVKCHRQWHYQEKKKLHALQ